MRFVRYSHAGGNPGDLERCSDLEKELTDALPTGISLYEIRDPSDIDRIALLYTANRSNAQPFTYFEVSEETLKKHGAEPKPTPDEFNEKGERIGSQFEFMRTRHYDVSQVSDLRAFAEDIGKQPRESVKKARIKELRVAEEQSLSYTTADEWAKAKKWG